MLLRFSTVGPDPGTAPCFKQKADVKAVTETYRYGYYSNNWFKAFWAILTFQNRRLENKHVFDNAEAPRGEICPIPIARLQDQQGILDEKQGGQIEENVNWSKTVDYIAELERQNAAEPAPPASRGNRADEVTVFIQALNNRMAFIGAAFDDCRRRLGVQNVAVGRSRRAVKGTKFSEMEHSPLIDLSNFKKLSAIYKGRFPPPHKNTADRGTLGPFKLIEDKKKFGSFITATDYIADSLAEIT
ncbi:hypothetical protein DL768_011212 [Monosporascus sp. mg162]|nr:hypothetical protein DL768_011212 [Monosporascus sp. mg162]